MDVLDLTYPTTAENLALDEALLETCEAGARGPTIRFWTPDTPAVVLGYSRPLSADVDVDACSSDRIGLERRSSGGGTVLQAPGVLNYAVILPLALETCLLSVTGAYRHVLEKTSNAVARLTGCTVDLRGGSDLTLGTRKFSGTAQRRTPNAVLVHGSLLLGLDIASVGRYLRMPDRQPEYRARRSHEEFLINLSLPAGRIKAALREAWDARHEAGGAPEERVQQLVRERYRTQEWIFRR